MLEDYKANEKSVDFQTAKVTSRYQDRRRCLKLSIVLVPNSSSTNLLRPYL